MITPSTADMWMRAQVEAAETLVKELPERVAKLSEPTLGAGVGECIRSLDVDAPLTVMYAFSCLCVYILANYFDWVFEYGFGIRDLQKDFFSCPPLQFFSFFDLRCYWRLFSHVLGHSSWNHLMGNLVILFLVGPACEQAFGAYDVGQVILYVAVFSAFAHMLFGDPAAFQLGASGVVFALILLNSLLAIKVGKVPITFICQVVLWVYKEMLSELWKDLTGRVDGTSNLAHLSGAFIGTFFGFTLHHERMQGKLTSTSARLLGKEHARHRQPAP